MKELVALQDVIAEAESAIVKLDGALSKDWAESDEERSSDGQ